MPKSSGVYAWYFRGGPPGVPTAGAHCVDGWYLLYVGISPRRPRSRDGAPSRGTLRARIRNHYTGDASRSTLRLSLGALLREELGLSLQDPLGRGRLTFGEGESRLSEWMSLHTKVCWVEHPEPWHVEHALLETVPLALNLDGNTASNFFGTLKAAREALKRA